MKIPPIYTISDEMLSLIANIEAQRLYFSSLNLENTIKENIQRVSLLKSSLFSARIEGNPLKISDFEFGNETEEEKKEEVFNIVKTMLKTSSTSSFVSFAGYCTRCGTF